MIDRKNHLSLHFCSPRIASSLFLASFSKLFSALFSTFLVVLFATCFSLLFSVNVFASESNRNIHQQLNWQRVSDWIDFNEQALKTVYGRLPSKSYDVIVVPASRRGGIVPWGEVNRDVGTRSGNEFNTVVFHINPGATLNHLKSDWTSYHEFSHLLIPYQGWGGRWFSEGLASYYQNVLQARVNTLSQEQAWGKLIAGFVRGVNRNPAPRMTLKELSRDMHDYGAFMRVYWSGAWYFLQVDIALRQQGKTLDQALKYLDTCCGRVSMSIEEMIRFMDKYSGDETFIRTYRSMIASKKLEIDWKLIESIGVNNPNRNLSVKKGSIAAEIMSAK